MMSHYLCNEVAGPNCVFLSEDYLKSYSFTVSGSWSNKMLGNSGINTNEDGWNIY